MHALRWTDAVVQIFVLGMAAYYHVRKRSPGHVRSQLH
jgi:hypothetical protein